MRIFFAFSPQGFFTVQPDQMQVKMFTDIITVYAFVV